MENFSPSEHRKNFFGSMRLWLCVCLVALALPLALRAQDTGYISGTVTDKSGAAVVGAEVVLTNVAGTLTRTTTTNGDGVYVVAGLPGATYNLVITAKGFQKFSAQKIVLNVAEKSRVDVQLSVGSVTEVVEVTGEAAAQVETSSSDLSSIITGKQIDHLMLNGRNFTQLVTLSPGVVNQNGSDEGKVGVSNDIAYSINGGRNEYNNWELDGGDNMDNGSNATLNVHPNLEAIAEFKVLTSNYGAQYGRNGSGTIEVETKSGTNAFHGSGFYYGRNEFFNARSWLEGQNTPSIKSRYRKHDYGYTIGGPVYIPNHFNSDKKRTFFFFSEEWRRETNVTSAPPDSSGTAFVNVPTDAERAGNFSDLCPDPLGTLNDCPIDPSTGLRFPGDTITPTPTGTALLALIPHAIPGLTFGGFPAFRQTVSEPTNWREELIRVDHNLTNNYRLTFRYIHDSWNTVIPEALWGNNLSWGGSAGFQNITTGFVGPGSAFVARLNANISPTLLNEFVASYTGDHIYLTVGGPAGVPPGFSMGNLFPGQPVPFGGLLPSFNLSSNAAYGGGFSTDTGYFPWNNANPTYTYRDNVTKVAAKHTLQFGAYLVFAQKNEQNSPNLQGILTFDSSNSAVSTGNAFADLLLGRIASFQQWSAKNKYYNRYRILEPYFQDDWRITNKLTLNLGLRISLFGTYRERYRQAFNFDPSQWVAANAPAIDTNGSVTQNAGALIPNNDPSGKGNPNGNPLNGVVQCGGKGGNFPLVPTSGFPTVNIGPSSNAGCLKGHLFNPAPRIGFAYDPRGNGKMAIRGGYGIFFEHTNGNEGNTESLESSAPLVLVATQSNVAPSVGPCAANADGGYGCIGGAGASVPIFPLSPFSIPNKAVWPYMQQWNLSVQKELPSHIVLSAAYVGSKGTHLTLINNLNQLHSTPSSQNPFGQGETLVNTGVVDPTGAPEGACAGPNGNLNANPALNNQPWSPGQTVPGTNGALNAQSALNLNVACGTAIANNFRTAFPGYGNLTELRNIADSHYNALQVSALRTVGDLTVSLAYTYSHSIDDSSDRGDNAFVDAYNIAANRANSQFDQRHSLSLSYVYALPIFKGPGLRNKALGNWTVQGITVAQTGLPFSVTNGANFGDNAGVANGVGTGSRPDLVGNPHSGFTANQDPSEAGPLFYNPNAFAIPTGLTFGNVGRNTLHLPGRVNFNFSAFKRFPINENAGFEFRWESFNLFNHTQFNSIDSSMPTPATAGTFAGTSFMHLTNTHDPRRMQFGLRFYF
jgi:hypothetical protein